MKPDKYLVIDFEATCCDQGTIAPDQMEIIEIGAVMVDAGDLRPVDAFQSFLRPVRFPTLTSFCTALTSIRQEDVDGAPSFAGFISAFKRWLYQYSGFVFCSWGDYDLKQLKQDCAFHDLPYPIGGPHVNVKRAFAGTHHRGIDDARNIARLLPYIFGDARLPASRSAT